MKAFWHSWSSRTEPSLCRLTTRQRLPCHASQPKARPLLLHSARPSDGSTMRPHSNLRVTAPQEDRTPQYPRWKSHPCESTRPKRACGKRCRPTERICTQAEESRTVGVHFPIVVKRTWPTDFTRAITRLRQESDAWFCPWASQSVRSIFAPGHGSSRAALARRTCSSLATTRNERDGLETGKLSARAQRQPTRT